jgi:hypothetical protein
MRMVSGAFPRTKGKEISDDALVVLDDEEPVDVDDVDDVEAAVEVEEDGDAVDELE